MTSQVGNLLGVCWAWNSHLGCEHVHDPIHCPTQQQSPHQEANKHHVWEEGAEVHHLEREG